MNTIQLLKHKFYLIFFLIPILGFSQAALIDYGFSDKPVEIPEKFKDEGEVILEKNIKIEIVSDDNAAQYILTHEKKWINSDEAIERNNRVYIPLRDQASLIVNKVRVISEDGVVSELSSEDIMEEIDEELGVTYQYFAVKGMAKGVIIEKISVVKGSPDVSGLNIALQGEIPILDMSFELIYPEHLVFQYKTYNGLNEPVLDNYKHDNSKYSLFIHQTEIPGILDDERYGNWDKHLLRFRYKLTQNKSHNTHNMFNYVDFSKNVYDNVNLTLDRRVQRGISDFVKEIPKSNDAFEQIKFIENKIKSSINYNKNFHQNQTLLDVIRNKQANEVELLQFYMAVLNEMNIESEIVFTNKRYSNIFDDDFESMEQIQDVILYFPSIDEYMDITAYAYRLPLINFNYTGNNGLFVRGVEYAGVKMGIGEIKQIKVPSGEITHDTQEIFIDFTEDVENPKVHLNFAYMGYSALNMQPLKDFASETQYDEILKEFVENYSQDSEILKLEANNEGLENVGFKPFTLEVDFVGKTQKAGNSILFQAGELIGRQMELYQEHPRVLPVEIYYPHYYTRRYKILLPDGYTIQNLDDFNFNKELFIDGESQASFISSYTQNANEILVTNTEFYHILHYPLDVFEEYREVINAAADFNKITLVLNKD